MEVPPFAESITEGDIRWIKAVGDSVREDEAVAEVETDKVSVLRGILIKSILIFKCLAFECLKLM